MFRKSRTDDKAGLQPANEMYSIQILFHATATDANDDPSLGSCLNESSELKEVWFVRTPSLGSCLHESSKLNEVCFVRTRTTGEERVMTYKILRTKKDYLTALALFEEI
jgi:hypothetical protein